MREPAPGNIRRAFALRVKDSVAKRLEQVRRKVERTSDWRVTRQQVAERALEIGLKHLERHGP